VYTDASLLLIALLRTWWRLSYTRVRDWLRDWPAVALACGFPLDPAGHPRIPSKGKLSKRWQMAGAPRVKPYSSCWSALPSRPASPVPATSSGKPVLLRVEFQGGHSMGSTQQQFNEELADEFAFLCQQMGMQMREREGA
jgi:hypothetical protein